MLRVSHILAEQPQLAGLQEELQLRPNAWALLQSSSAWSVCDLALQREARLEQNPAPAASAQQQGEVRF